MVEKHIYANWQNNSIINSITLTIFIFRWIVARMLILSVLPPWAVNFTICVLTAALTQVASNTATANVLLPILADMALTICVNPIYLIMSAALTSSYAFMLPVSFFLILLCSGWKTSHLNIDTICLATSKVYLMFFISCDFRLQLHPMLLCLVPQPWQ